MMICAAAPSPLKSFVTNTPSAIATSGVTAVNDCQYPSCDNVQLR
jgi:hypothetical protein